MVDDNLVKESAVLINMAYLERRYIDKCAKNVEYLCAALIDIELDENPFREPDKMYRIILRKIISNKHDVLGSEAFKNKLSLYKTYKNEYGISNLTDDELYNLVKKDYITDLKRELIEKLKSVYYSEDLTKLNKIDGYIKSRTTVTDKVENSYEERATIYNHIEEINKKCKSVLPSEKIRAKYSNQPTPKGTVLHASFEDGYVDIRENNGPADASFLVKKSLETDPPTLHICFRGTDNKAKSVVSYFVNDYPNMDRQYKKIRGVMNAIISEQRALHEKEYPGVPLHVHFSGHSLGASMAEQALESHKNNKNVIYTASIFANPGSKHYLQKVVDKLDDIDNSIYKKCFSNKMFLSLGENAVTASIKNSYNLASKMFKAPLFLAVGMSSIAVSLSRKFFNAINLDSYINYNDARLKIDSIDNFTPKVIKSSLYTVAHTISEILQASVKPINDTTNFVLNNITETKKNDKRLVVFNHVNDYIPEIGSKLFDHVSKGEILLNNKIKLNEEKNFLLRKVNFDYHNAYNYGTEVIKIVSNGDYKKIISERDKNIAKENILQLRGVENNEMDNKLKPA